ncbi:MAG TPA: tetrahydrofolate dehydrogenase/cyclohydrolase catalytic domain-containing protein, partial [Aggregicoccus sp.]|nr:tetrahydrofolate dehydrogenase/cyclohydrolase catalytic domain-containing protein [Aggregicoccus sp.]
MAQLIDGKAVAARVREQVRQDVERLKAERGFVPGLAVVRVGEDPASKVYVTGKKKAALEVGFNSWEQHLPDTTTQAELLAVVEKLNADPAVHGIL